MEEADILKYIMPKENEVKNLGFALLALAGMGLVIGGAIYVNSLDPCVVEAVGDGLYSLFDDSFWRYAKVRGIIEAWEKVSVSVRC